MCTVSLVLEHGQIQWPKIDQWPIQPQYDYWKQYMEMVEKAKEYDRKSKQPDCEDINKLPILEKILKRLDELETLIKKE